MSLYENPLIKSLQPVVLIPAKYGGQYEGDLWVALPNCSAPEADYPEAFGKESVAALWWSDLENLMKVGVGETPNDAFSDLLAKIPGVAAAVIEMNVADGMYDVAKHVDAARRDMFALVTAQHEGVANGKEEVYDILLQQIVNDWVDEDDAALLISIFTGICYELMTALAFKDGTDVGELIRQVALKNEGE